MFFFFFSSRRRHTRFDCDWSSDVCSSDLGGRPVPFEVLRGGARLSFTIVPDTASGVDPQYPKRPRSYGFIGAQVQPGVTRVRKPVGEAIASGWQETTRTAVIILGFLKGLVLRQISVRELGGPT